ncbi:MAG: cupin domain-containing protein [bacterium]
MDDLTAAIGEKIRELRQQNGWTIQKLADVTRLSPGGIYKIEAGQMTPSITTMMKIARAFNRRIGYFIGEDEPVRDIEIVKRAKRKKFTSTEAGISAERIAGSLEDSRIFSVVLTIGPGRTSVEKPIAHKGEELILCLQGQLELTFKGGRHVLRKGDSAHYKSESPHRWKNTGKSDARALFVMTPTPFSSEVAMD